MGAMLPTAKMPRDIERYYERGPKLKDVDPYDTVQVILAREQHIRDEAVYDEKIKLMREAISVCYKQYHMNHAYKCRPLYTEYLDMIQHKNAILHDNKREISASEVKNVPISQE